VAGASDVTWLAECSADLVREALRVVAPELSGYPLALPGPVGKEDPLLLITRLVPGSSLFEVIDSIDRDRAGWQLACFLAALHHPAARERAEAAVGALTGAQIPPATTQVLRERFVRLAWPDQRQAVLRWCDWADMVLASPGRPVLVHGDLHGDNQVWDRDELRLVVDFETIGGAEPEYDLRTFLVPGWGPAWSC
jgi:aminoglycoside phosphotransferase (APT) family kinase protein